MQQAEAYHPVTGKPIRKKTLVWLRNAPSSYPNAHRYARWYSLVTSHTLADQWHQILGSYPSAIALTESNASVRDWLRTRAPKQQQLLFLSKDVMTDYGLENFNKEQFMNVICLEEIAPMFPHVLHSYTQNETAALTVLAIAAVFRVQRLVGVSAGELAVADVSQYAKQLNDAYKLTVTPTQEPEQLVLIQQYYQAPKARRQKEIKKCLLQNSLCPYVDTILLLNEADYSDEYPKSSKIQQEIIQKRLTYADVIRTIQTNVPENAYVVFANSDIYLDPSWRDLWSLDLSSTFLSLLRYEEPADAAEEPQLFGPRADSQDTWVVSAAAVKARTWDWNALDFPFGKAGCDNAINLEMLRKKFVVANPSLSLRTIHCHSSQVRTYDPNDVVEKPIFLYLEPTGLHDLQPFHDLKSAEQTWPAPKPFERRVYAKDEKSLKTYCAMVSREEVMYLSPEEPNTFIPSAEERVYSLKNAFTTTNGLAYGYDKIYLGSRDTMKKSWASTTISHLTPSIGVQNILAAPLSDEVATNTLSFMTQYLSKILRLKAAGYQGDMWLPRDAQRTQEFLQMFKWDTQVMPVMPRDKDIVGYASNVTLLEPRSSSLIYKEEVEALRAMLRGYEPTVLFPKRVVIFQDDTFLSSDDVYSLENVLENSGYEVNVVYPARSSATFILQRLLGVGHCICPPGTENLLWMLPHGAKVLNLMPELNIKGDAAHMAGASSLECWIGLLPRAKGDARRDLLLDVVMHTLGAMAVTKPKNLPTTEKPLLVMPSGFEGYHAHSGDSFREMAAMWAEKGLVNLEVSKDTPYVWWGGIGKTLLYDRANFDWITKTPAAYETILCGNPDSSKVAKGTQWSFWPRRPKLLEERVEKGLVSWEQRTSSLVFYGKVENNIQKEHRKNELHKACDEFTMPIGANQPYKYSQAEYLEKLAAAKFGLCLAGYGPKCNREIECMALGTVPLVAPDVDMVNYANPPVEGVHYLRLKSFDPEEASTVVKAISKEGWEEMSAAAHTWWKQNASMMGLFELTKHLSRPN
jgi:hypothetical protein